jgi:hypothetical protein
MARKRGHHNTPETANLITDAAYALTEFHAVTGFHGHAPREAGR